MIGRFIEDYLRERLGIGSKLIRNNRIAKIQKENCFCRSRHSPKILKAVEEIISENLCIPILLGNKSIIKQIWKNMVSILIMLR